MKRLSILALFWLGLFQAPAHAADAALYSVAGIEVDATAGSATAARDIALANGRPAAWERLYRRITPSSEWDLQPAADGVLLERLILSMQIDNERRSTTRYLAEVTYNFNPAEVQELLRINGIRFAQARARPVLVVPIIEGIYDPESEWARSWAQPSIAQGLVPVILPFGDAADQPVLGRADLTTLGWEALEPLAQRYDVEDIAIARATPDGGAAQLIIVSEQDRLVEAVPFGGSNFATTADSAAQRLAQGWKETASVDYSRRFQVIADVAFGAPQEWAAIRQRLSNVGTVAGVDVLGISVNEARIALSYFGQAEQLSAAQQNLIFDAAPDGYMLQLGNVSVVDQE